LADVEDLRQALWHGGARRRQIGDAQPDPGERPRLSRTVGGEERQLAVARVGADEREAVGSLDHVHTEMPGRELCDAIAVGDPQRDMIEAGRLHSGQLTHGDPVYTVVETSTGVVGWPEPPARSSVTATVEPAGAGRVSVITWEPPPGNRPAGLGVLPS